MVALYNEIDPKAAAWLRELIRQGHIAPGDVSEADIRDLDPAYVGRYAQFHAFAGIGVWSYALRRAGWSDDRPVWTGSCPCQPFSAAGKGGGFDDERHLWPHFHWLISQCHPDDVVGEQVASKDGLAWIDLVQADLEGTGYASGALDFCSAGVGAPHIRQRLYWFGERGTVDAERKRGRSGQLGRQNAGDAGLAGEAGELANPDGRQRDGQSILRGVEHDGQDAGRAQGGGELGPRRVNSGMAKSNGWDAGAERQQRGGEQRQQPEDGGLRTMGGHAVPHGARDEGEYGIREVAPHAGPVNGGWRNADWIYCRNGEWRPVESGTFPLATGDPARVGRLRGYGNAINAEAATVFIQSYLEAKEEMVQTNVG